jgi:Ca2+/Na+ antiporter
MANNRINNKVAYEFYNKFEKFDLAVLIFVNIIIDILLFLGYCADQGLLEHGVVNNINIVESVICMLYYVYIFCIYLLFWKHRNVNDDGEKFENKSSKLYFHFQGIFSVILFLTTTVFVCYAAIRGLRDHFHVFEKGYDI